MSDFISSVFAFSLIAAWLTSFVNSIITANWLLAVLDWFIFPIGIIHGIYLWF